VCWVCRQFRFILVAQQTSGGLSTTSVAVITGVVSAVGTLALVAAFFGLKKKRDASVGNSSAGAGEYGSLGH